MVTFNREKLKRLIHYAAYRCVDTDHLDSVKMNKALWYSDLGAYVATGQAITGAKYLKKPMGPVASLMPSLAAELEAEKAIAIRQLDPDAPKQYLALTAPDMSIFSGEEMRMIGDAIHLVCKHSSRGISQKSHDIVWKLAELDEEIPYYTMLAGHLRDVNAADVAWAKEVLARA